MAYNLQLAERLRNYLSSKKISFVEKKMFGGLAFLVNDKMCINVSGDKLMCRFNPELQTQLEKKPGFEKMIMRGKEMKGYGYICSNGYSSKNNFEFWINTCISFNDAARSSKTEKQ